MCEAAAFGRETRLRELLAATRRLVGTWIGDGFTALHLALFSGEESALRLLIEHGADLEAPSRHRTIRGVRPLHTAAFVRERDLAEILLDAGAQVDGRALGGITALHSAAEHGDETSPGSCSTAAPTATATDDRAGARPTTRRDAGFKELAELLALSRQRASPSRSTKTVPDPAVVLRARSEPG